MENEKSSTNTNPNNTNNTSEIKKSDIEKKFKEDIKKYYLQLKNGCYRDLCYNQFCWKSNTYPKEGDNELLVKAMKLAKSNESNFCMNTTIQIDKLNDFKFLEKMGLLYQLKPINDFKLIKDMYTTINIDFEKIKEFGKISQEEFESNMTRINSINTYIIELYETNEKAKQNNMSMNGGNGFNRSRSGSTELTTTSNDMNDFLFYVFYLNLRIFFFTLNSSKFDFEYNYTGEFLSNFHNFKIIGNKILEKNYLGKDYNISDVFDFIPKENFIHIVDTFQNFLTLFLWDASNKQEMLDQYESPNYEKKVLEDLMEAFNFIYLINKWHNIVDYKIFYNETISKHYDFREECRNYFHNLNLKRRTEKGQLVSEDEDDELYKFSLITYQFLFDSAAKSEILYIFNYKKQRQEMVSSINSMFENINNPDSLMLSNIQNNISLLFEVRRSHVIEDTMNLVSKPEFNFKKQLRIKFVGEEGIDEGGVKKEFFMLVIRQLFDPNYSMFNYDEKNRFFWFNQFSYEAKIKFELIGIILALAIFNNVILDIKFPKVVYKKLLDFKISYEDLKEIDEDIYKNFKFLIDTKDENLEEAIDMNFTTSVENYGMKEIIPLIENGENIKINQTNKLDYISRYTDWYFNRSISQFFEPFKVGFYRVCDKTIFSEIILPEELESIICGSVILDFKELEKSSKYDDGYTEESLTILHFWEVIHEMNAESQKKFLVFLTGCDRAPINGLGNLVITISRFGPDSDKLPCAHTCFNHLLLPDYENKDKLKERIYIAINNSEGFGLM